MPLTVRKRVRQPTRQRANARTRQPLIITIDGPACSGKSTVARLLAKALGLTYLDTGATYRALAYAVLRGDPSALGNVSQLVLVAHVLPLRVVPGRAGGLHVYLDALDITRAIRSEDVSRAAATISTFPEVRAVMVARQRELAKGQGLVVEGRDTGSVVFPKAPHKFFLTADLGIRAERRRRELLKLYGEPTPLGQIRHEMRFRDLLDQTRPVGRLVQPKGAVAIDTTHLTARQVVERMLRRIRR